MKVVILAGGTGTRLWPLSTKNTPKQFLNLYGDKSLLEHTYDRVVSLVGGDNVFVSTSAQYSETIIDMFAGKDFGGVIVETEKRNTGPAMLFCFKTLLQNHNLGESEAVVFLPADHIIKPHDVFMNYLAYGEKYHGENAITVFGIVPRHPHTGFGYIKAGEMVHEGSYMVETFTEKPDHETASTFLAVGGYYRNSGIYMCSYSTLLQELKKYYTIGVDYLTAQTPAEEGFGSLTPVSFDYMVAEKTTNAVVVPMSLQWSDVGTWEVIDEISEKTVEGNVLIGDVQVDGVEDTYVSAQDVNIKLVGVDNLIVVQQGNNIMIAKKGKSQSIKKLLE